MAALERWRAVVILDNCEQVVDGAAAFADSLLARCPTLTLLATSREALVVDSERVLSLQPLGSADDGDEAVALFFARAHLVAPDARLDRNDVAALCDALDRLPLAIELAAARVDRMDIGEIAGSLFRGRADRRSRARVSPRPKPRTPRRSRRHRAVSGGRGCPGGRHPRSRSERA